MAGALASLVTASQHCRMGAGASKMIEEGGRAVSDEVKFSVNGKDVVVGKEVGPHVRLARYLRDSLHLPGTKISCNQGGCGACVVTVLVRDPATGMQKTRAINSCLVPVLSCSGWAVTTVEGVGNTKALHPIQASIAKHSATQCGFCTPGMVMTANSLLLEEESPGAQEVEDHMGANLCRCTGYRPILDSVKDLVSCKEKGVCLGRDIEDLGDWVCPVKTQESEISIVRQSDSGTWVTPTTVKQVLELLSSLAKDETYRLVAGNTGVGVYPEEGRADLYVDISNIAELKQVSKDPLLKLGSGVCLADTIKTLRHRAEESPEEGGYCRQLAHHLTLVASPTLRSSASLGGNLMMRHQFPEFPSDLFILLEAVGAQLEVARLEGGAVQTSKLSPSSWINSPMDKRLLLSICLPSLPPTARLLSHKITPRAVFAHAYVSCAVLLHLEGPTGVSRPRICYTGVSTSFLHASQAEEYLAGKDLATEGVIGQAVSLAGEGVEPDVDPHDSSPEYRKGLVQGLLYKCLLAALGQGARKEVRSGAKGVREDRGVSKGSHSYNSDESWYPVTQPVEKLEGKLQATGEAQYGGDIPSVPGELHAALVLSTCASCSLEKVDPSPALALQGVEAFFKSQDLRGINNLTYNKKFAQPLFAEDKITHAGQIIGIIVAVDPETAHRAAGMVEVTYKDKKEPVLSIKQALRKEGEGQEGRISGLSWKEFREGEDCKRGGWEEHIQELGAEEEEVKEGSTSVSGEFEVGSQHHMHLETHTTLARPNEEGGLDVTCATQWIDPVQRVIAKTLNLPESSINMCVRRLGGAYGGKITNSTGPAVACSLAAFKLGKPVRLVMDLATTLEVAGKRLPYLARYKATVGPDLKLSSVVIKLFCDSGSSYNESTADVAVSYAKGAYSSPAWRITPMAVLTDTASNTYCRAPGSTQGHATMEMVIEHLAAETGKEPLEVREANMVEDATLKEVLGRLKTSSDYEARRVAVEQYNKDNLWMKRGLSLVPIQYPHTQFGTRYIVHIAVYHDDGSVAVSHGGIEMGQGVNTKVAQVVARELGVSMDVIKIKPTNNLINPNSSFTAGSMGSEGNVAAAVRACADLKSKMAKVKQEEVEQGGKEDLPWPELVKKCYTRGVDLTGHHMGHSIIDGLAGYIVWAAAVTEVQLDVLTGMTNIRRMDFIEDTGMATSPAVDLGQVEGALVMGLGLWTSEQVRYDPATGRLLDNSTWHYKVPTSADIPEDFRVELYDSGNNPGLVLGSKAVGEPGVLGGVSVLTALRQAITAARKDSGLENWFQLDGPATAEKIALACAVSPNRLLP